MAPLTLQHIKGNTYYIPSPTNIGIYVEDDEAYLIDSGNDKEAGRLILRLLDEQGWRLKAIINTHSNADHIGGNQYLQNKTNCKIMASANEMPFIHYPELEAAFLYGGFPDASLRNKFLMAKSSKVDCIVPSEGNIENTSLKTISLPGHYFDMIGIVTPDEVAFIADSLFPERIIEKYHIFFLYDIKSHFETLNKLSKLEADTYVPSHGDPYNSLEHIIAVNRKEINEIAQAILSYLDEPKTGEELLQLICERYQILLDSVQYVLIYSTIRSFLTYLCGEDMVTKIFENGKMLWAKK